MQSRVLLGFHVDGLAGITSHLHGEAWARPICLQLELVSYTWLMGLKVTLSDSFIFERWTKIMMGEFSASGQTFDIQELSYRITINVITDFLLGESAGSSQSPTSGFVSALTDVRRVQTMLFDQMWVSFQPLSLRKPFLTISIANSPLEKFIPCGKCVKGIEVLKEFMFHSAIHRQSPSLQRRWNPKNF